MIILSMQLGHNASVALAGNNKDGHIQVLNAVSQERFDNIKNSSAFPIAAANWCLEANGLRPEEVDIIAICGLNVYSTQLEALETNNSGRKSRLKNIYTKIDLKYNKTAPLQLINNIKLKRQDKQRFRDKEALLYRLKEEGYSKAKVEFVEHHICHAHAPLCFFGCPEENYAILTLDGSGDKYCASVNLWNGKQLQRLSSTKWAHSLGYIYSKTTAFLGMKPLEHEYKVMGLAAYSKPEYYMKTFKQIFENTCWVKKDGSMEFDSAIPLNRFDHYLKEKIPGGGIRFDNLAGALQYLDESLVCDWVKEISDKIGIHAFMTSGGVFMNVKANMKLQELDEVEKINFMPTCGDETNPFGAIYYIATNNQLIVDPLNTLYLGHAYSNDDVKDYISERALFEKYDVTYYDDVEIEIAKLLADYIVVARVHGKAEFGARSLGNRAILANPSNLQSFYMVNDQIKIRDFWMPFAPTILDTDEERYLINNKHIKAPYMITSFNTTQEARMDLRAAMHQQDKTVRPQILTREMNASYYHIIEEFKRITGIGGILNTSFNLHGYPLAEQLPEAFFTFENSGLQYMAIENYIFKKKPCVTTE